MTSSPQGPLSRSPIAGNRDIALPAWFLAFMLEQLGGEVVISDDDSLFLSEKYNEVYIDYYRTDHGKLIVKIRKENNDQ